MNIQKLWQKYSPLAHLLGWLATMIFTAGVVWANVSGYDERLSKLEASGVVNVKDIAVIDGKLDLLLNHFRLKYRQ